MCRGQVQKECTADAEPASPDQNPRRTLVPSQFPFSNSVLLALLAIFNERSAVPVLYFPSVGMAGD